MSSPYTQLDFTNIIRHVFDEAEDRLRVDASVTVVLGEVEVIISHIDDSIRLGDGTSLITSTLVSGKQGLDVNIINTSLTITAASLPLPLGAATDSVLQSVRDGLVLNGSYISTVVSVGTVAVEAKVGGSTLSNRGLVKIYNNSSKTMYHGPATVTTSGANIGEPIVKGQTVYLPFGSSTKVYLIAATAANDAIVQEVARA